MALDALGRHAEATRDWERAVELDDGHDKAFLRAKLAESRLRRSRKDKDAAGCLAAAAEYEALKLTDAGGLYDAACNRAICAAVIPLDPKTPAADAARLAQEQADLAMAWLHKAVAAGFSERRAHEEGQGPRRPARARGLQEVAGRIGSQKEMTVRPRGLTST